MPCCPWCAHSGKLPEAEIEGMLGPAIVQQLRVHTAGIISLIGENVESSWAAITALRETLRRIHPGRRFIRVERPPET
jgi:hypothetical protein